jgi:hypothetical protein
MWGRTAFICGDGGSLVERGSTSHSTGSITTQSIGFRYKCDGSFNIYVHFVLITGNSWFAIKILFSTLSALKVKNLMNLTLIFLYSGKKLRKVDKELVFRKNILLCNCSMLVYGYPTTLCVKLCSWELPILKTCGPWKVHLRLYLNRIVSSSLIIIGKKFTHNFLMARFLPRAASDHMGFPHIHVALTSWRSQIF